MHLLFLLFSAAAALATPKDNTVKATDIGIIGDGTTINTATIQSAVDSLADNGGGCLRFPKGKYLTGSIMLRSNVHLHLDRNATILGSTNPDDYRAVATEDEDIRKDNSKLALLIAENARNITITGKGCIDGRGLNLALAIDSLHHAGIRVDPLYNNRRHRPNETARPKLIFLSRCNNIRIEETEMRNSAAWGLSFDLCKDLTLRKLNITNRAYWNNDGIDITDCHNVVINKCRINSADDGICLKSYHTDGANDSITISDCHIRSSASAVKFGTASWGAFRNVRIDNIRIRDTFRSAIAIESVDGAVIENIHITDIKAKNTGNAIFIRLGHRSGSKPGKIENIRIENMKVKIPFARPDINYDLRGPEPDFFHNPLPSSISGIPGYPIRNIILGNITISCPGRASKGMAYIPLTRLNDIPENINGYPEFTMFGELPCWGLFLRHVDGIRLDNVRLKLRHRDFRPDIIKIDVKE